MKDKLFVLLLSTISWSMASAQELSVETETTSNAVFQIGIGDSEEEAMAIAEEECSKEGLSASPSYIANKKRSGQRVMITVECR